MRELGLLMGLALCVPASASDFRDFDFAPATYQDFEFEDPNNWDQLLGPIMPRISEPMKPQDTVCITLPNGMKQCFPVESMPPVNRLPVGVPVTVEMQPVQGCSNPCPQCGACMDQRRLRSGPVRRIVRRGGPVRRFVRGMRARRAARRGW